MTPIERGGRDDTTRSARALLAVLSGRLDDRAVDSYFEAMEKEEETPPSILQSLQVIDTKATGLLTHVSVMIAGLGISASFLAQHPIEEAIIVGEMSIYLLLAVGCLRCLAVSRALKPPSDSVTALRKIKREFFFRHEIYRMCNLVSIGFTIFVFISLPVMLLWKPQGG